MAINQVSIEYTIFFIFYFFYISWSENQTIATTMKPCGFNFLFLQIGFPNSKDCIRILLSFVNVVNHGCEEKIPNQPLFS